MIPLGYGKFVRADRVYALVPLEGGARGDRRRTLVHVEGIEGPLVASRSERALADDLALALGQEPPGGSRADRGHPGQASLF
jgi:plasmid stabilization system protein ParE